MSSDNHDAVRAAYDGIAATYVEHVTPVARYYPRVAAFLAAHALPGRVLLDLGCGPGHLTSSLPASVRVVGLDLAPAMIELARQARPDGHYLVHDFHAPFPLAAASIDVVLSAGAFDFCFNVDNVVRELARVSRPSARVFLTFVERSADDPPSLPLSPAAPGVSMALYSCEELSAAFDRHGFSTCTFDRGVGYYNRGLARDIVYSFWELARD